MKVGEGVGVAWGSGWGCLWAPPKCPMGPKMDMVPPTVYCWCCAYFASPSAWQRPGGARRQPHPEPPSWWQDDIPDTIKNADIEAQYEARRRPSDYIE